MDSLNPFATRTTLRLEEAISAAQEAHYSQSEDRRTADFRDSLNEYQRQFQVAVEVQSADAHARETDLLEFRLPIPSAHNAS
ncbi:hypothetical protein DXG01_009096 [Tephrocybe rancida]|nr:hypothetical protein DXG01_009096 [Tephrocybe rancida]